LGLRRRASLNNGMAPPKKGIKAGSRSDDSQVFEVAPEGTQLHVYVDV